MAKRLAIAALGTLSAFAVAAPQAGAQSFTIRAKGNGDVTAIGDFKPTRDPTVGAATRAFGQPSSMRRDDSSCIIGWRAIGLRITFANFGASNDVCSDGKSQSASAFGRNWRTPRGLKIGHSVKRLRRAYPRALRRGTTYRLVGAKSQFGVPGRYSVLAAKANGSRVKAFKLFVGAAGE